MNGVALVLLVLGIFVCVIGFRNRQDNVLSAVSGRRVGATTLG